MHIENLNKKYDRKNKISAMIEKLDKILNSNEIEELIRDGKLDEESVNIKREIIKTYELIYNAQSKYESEEFKNKIKEQLKHDLQITTENTSDGKSYTKVVLLDKEGKQVGPTLTMSEDDNKDTQYYFDEKDLHVGIKAKEQERNSWDVLQNKSTGVDFEIESCKDKNYKLAIENEDEFNKNVKKITSGCTSISNGPPIILC